MGNNIYTQRFPNPGLVTVYLFIYSFSHSFSQKIFLDHPGLGANAENKAKVLRGNGI